MAGPDHRPRRTRPLAALVVTAFLVASCGGDDDTAATEPTIEGVVVEADQTNGHTEEAVAYTATPPSGGDHAPFWLTCDIYDTPVPEELAVHSLEHGAVWIAHDVGLDGDDLDAVRGLAAIDPDRVIVSPHRSLETTVVAVAWERRLEVDDPADPRLAAFVEAYVGGQQAPEPGAPCTGGVGVG